MTDDILEKYARFCPSVFICEKDKAEAYLYTGLAGEVGEVCSIYAKRTRDKVYKDYIKNMKKELGDCLYFIQMLAIVNYTSIEELMELNIEKLKDRQERGQIGGNGDER